MRNELDDLIFEECEKAKRFIRIPGIYKHFKEVKNGEEMLYVANGVSVPISYEDLGVLVSEEEYSFLEFYHTELEKKIKIYRFCDQYFHLENVEKEKLIIYTGLYGKRETYLRPVSMFLSKVDTKKYPTARQKYRLERVL